MLIEQQLSTAHLTAEAPHYRLYKTESGPVLTGKDFAPRVFTVHGEAADFDESKLVGHVFTPVYGLLCLVRTKGGFSHAVFVTAAHVAAVVAGTVYYACHSYDFVPLSGDKTTYNTNVRMVRHHLRHFVPHFALNADACLPVVAGAPPAAPPAAAPAPAPTGSAFDWFANVRGQLTPADGVLRCIVGCVTSEVVDGVGLAVVSRRSRYMAGTRYGRRGLDVENNSGNAANFAVTELVVWSTSKPESKASFVQMRGSVPLRWWQVQRLDTKKPPIFHEFEKCNEDVCIHFDRLTKRFGEILSIDTLDQTGLEGALSETYANARKEHHVRFDLHHECKNLRYDRLDKLIALIRPDLDRYGITCPAHGQRQTGTVRVNCLDCLDRTNVTETRIAREMLPTLLKAATGATSETGEVAISKDVEAIFRHVWLANGDALSRQYAGTNAMKRDYTRTGKRTIAGALEDFWNGCVRYVGNNFLDATKQDALDFALGAVAVDNNGNKSCENDILECYSQIWMRHLLLALALVVTAMSLISGTLIPILVAVIIVAVVATVMYIKFPEERSLKPRLTAKYQCKGSRLSPLAHHSSHKVADEAADPAPASE